MATYGTEVGVKSRCGFSIEETTQDFQISQALNYADGCIDSAFRQLNKTVPSPTPQLIKDAAEDLATYWMLRNTRLETAKEYLESGTRNLSNYIIGEYYQGIFERTTEM